MPAELDLVARKREGPTGWALATRPFEMTVVWVETSGE